MTYNLPTKSSILPEQQCAGWNIGEWLGLTLKEIEPTMVPYRWKHPHRRVCWWRRKSRSAEKQSNVSSAHSNNCVSVPDTIIYLMKISLALWRNATRKPSVSAQNLRSSNPWYHWASYLLYLICFWLPSMCLLHCMVQSSIFLLVYYSVWRPP